MTSYVIKRLLILIPTLLLLSLVVFFVVNAIPGDAIDAIQARSTKMEIDREALEKQYGLDAPMMVQYARWMGFIPNVSGVRSGLLQGEFGYSVINKTQVKTLISNAAPVTFELAVMALFLMILISLPIGIISATRQEGLADYIGRSFAILCIAVPGFWIGTLIVVFPAIWWGYMPPIMLIKFAANPWGNIKMFLLPALVLAMTLAGSTMRMVRTTMLEVLRQDYIRTAWAKGLRESSIISTHALKNSLIPVVSVIGIQIPYLIGGTVIIEEIFSLAGLGRLVMDALNNRDEMVLCGLVMMFAVILMLVNLLIDLFYAYLNPNIRYN